MIGTTVGKYRILERLGRGGMGIVYKALDETLDRVVAIKVLNPDLSDAELLKRFRSEAISLARLNHPGIATIYELHRHDDELLMVMEFVRGETLQSLSERLGPLEPPQATHLIVQILDALTHAHRAGVVHRDLKPANVMVSDTGMVKVMDFGIARMLGGEHFTQTGFMMGTPAYMAPEQVLGQEIDGRADLYSVGVLFYRLLSRELPFKADTAISMAQKQIAEAPTPIGKFRPDLPAWCEEVIAKALSKSPDDRYQTAEAFRSTLTAAVTPANLGDLPTMATPTALDLTLPQPSKVFPPPTGQADLRGTALTASSGVSVAPSPSGATPGPATAPVERTGSSVVLGPKHLVSLGALLALLIAAIAVVGFFAFKRNNAGSQTAVIPPAAAVPEAANTPATAPDQQPTAVTGSQPPQPAPAETPAPPAAVPPATVPPAAVPPATTPTGKPAPPSSTAQANAAARKAKAAAAKTPEVVAPAPAEPVAPPPPPVEPPPPPPKPEVPAVTFKDVKVLVAQGDNMREREAILTLTGDHLSITDRSGKAQILSVPYTAIQQGFFSRSKQPKWKTPDGKQQEAAVDLGKMGFFRGERNWVILTTSGAPVFFRLEDGDLRTALPVIQERSGVKIQR